MHQGINEISDLGLSLKDSYGIIVTAFILTLCMHLICRNVRYYKTFKSYNKNIIAVQQPPLSLPSSDSSSDDDEENGCTGELHLR